MRASGTQRARAGRGGRSARLTVWLLLLVGLGDVEARAADDLLELRLDTASYLLESLDRQRAEPGPRIGVALGSPGEQTPTGRFTLSVVVLKPAWTPGLEAQGDGARPEPASLTTPMGVAKIPFAERGSIALHGGGDPRVLGKPVSGGCVRATDADLLRVIAWLDRVGALAPGVTQPNGEVHRHFRRRAQIVVR